VLLPLAKSSFKNLFAQYGRGGGGVVCKELVLKRRRAELRKVSREKPFAFADGVDRGL
jgi:hypothetical protein